MNRALQEHSERVTSLIEDGFFIRSIYAGRDMVLTTLRHHANGNVVTIKTYPGQGTLIQSTNGRVTHEAHFANS